MSLKKEPSDLLQRLRQLMNERKVKDAVNILIKYAQRGWERALIDFKREKIFINKYGDKRTTEIINQCIAALINQCPYKYKKRYEKFIKTISPLNAALEMIADNLKRVDFWQLSNSSCVSALLARFEQQVSMMSQEAIQNLHNMVEKRGYVDLRNMLPHVKTMDEQAGDTDMILQELASALTLNLQFLKRRHRGIPLADITAPLEVYKAGTAEIAGQSWLFINYLIDQIAYSDWHLVDIDSKHGIYRYAPKDYEDYFRKRIGDKREMQWLMQLHFDLQRDVPPDAFEEMQKIDPLKYPQNQNELQWFVEITELCHDIKALELKLSNNISVREYFRAWCVLQEEAKVYLDRNKCSLTSNNQVIDAKYVWTLTKDEIILLLTNKGKLSSNAAIRCLDKLVFWNTGKDVFSSPVLPANQSDNYFLLANIFYYGNPVRSALRLLAEEDIDLGFKGISSENEAVKLFNKINFKCHQRIKYEDAAGDSDIDCLAYKDGILFVCEIKNIVPIESVFDRYKAKQILIKAANQASRGADYSKKNSSSISSLLGVNIKKSTKIVPLVLTNLFGFTGNLISGVPVCDFSVLGRLCGDNFLNANMMGNEGRNVRLAYRNLWDGNIPTADEVYKQVMNPFQMDYTAQLLEPKYRVVSFASEFIFKVFQIAEKMDGVDVM